MDLLNKDCLHFNKWDIAMFKSANDNEMPIFAQRTEEERIQAEKDVWSFLEHAQEMSPEEIFQPSDAKALVNQLHLYSLDDLKDMAWLDPTPLIYLLGNAKGEYLITAIKEND